MPYKIDFAELKERVSIEQVAELLGLTLRKSGAQYRCACPVHDGGDRGMVITPGKNLWYCFSEKKGGDQLALYAHINSIEVLQAAEEIAAQTGTETSEPVNRPTSSVDSTKSERAESPVFDPDKFADRHKYDGEIDGLSAPVAKQHRIGFQRGKLYLPICPPDVKPVAFAQVEGGKIKLMDEWLVPNLTKLKRA